MLKPTPELNSVYKYMYVKVISIAKNSQGEDFFALFFSKYVYVIYSVHYRVKLFAFFFSLILSHFYGTFA